jgi:hypothetical protein
VSHLCDQIEFAAPSGVADFSDINLAVPAAMKSELGHIWSRVSGHRMTAMQGVTHL